MLGLWVQAKQRVRKQAVLSVQSKNRLSYNVWSRDLQGHRNTRLMHHVVVGLVCMLATLAQ